MGQGHFMDDSDEFNSDSDDTKKQAARNKPVSIDEDEDERQKEELFGLLYHGGRRGTGRSVNSASDANNDDDDDDNYDHESFLENMLAKRRNKSEEDELKQ